MSSARSSLPPVLRDLGPLEPLVEAIAERVAERVADLVVERLGGASPATPRLLTKQQLATALTISTATLDRYIRKGLVVATVRLGGPDGPQRFDLGAVQAALERASSSERTSAPPATRGAAHVDAPPRLLKRGSRPR